MDIEDEEDEIITAFVSVLENRMRVTPEDIEYVKNRLRMQEQMISDINMKIDSFNPGQWIEARLQALEAKELEMRQKIDDFILSQVRFQDKVIMNMISIENQVLKDNKNG